jgi:hypothetical protein
LFCKIIATMLKSSMHCPRLRAPQNCFRPIQLLIFTLLLAAHTASAQTTTTNRALKLDGNGSYVELPPNIFKDLTQATIEVWARWTDFANYSRLFEFGAGYQSVSLFNHATNADLRFNVYPRYAKNDPSSMFTAYARGLLRTNEWMHLAAVCGPGGMKLYANGRLVAQHTNTTTFADIHLTQTNRLGRGLARNPTDRDFRGEIDEVRVWDHRRTLAQIRDHMFQRLTGKEQGLTHLWNFDDGTADDSGPHAHDGILIGKARIGRVDLDLTPAALPSAEPSKSVSQTVSKSASDSVTRSLPPSLSEAGPSKSASDSVTHSLTDSLPAWWIAGSLFSLVALLACLLLMLRRSPAFAGATSRLLPAAPPHPLLTPATPGPDADKELKARALAELTDFAKQSLVQGLYSQRAALLETHQKAQTELARLEARVVALRLPERIQAYEQRIAELEAQLGTRSEELRELTLATLHVLREKLEEEKQKEVSRFN